MSAMGRRWVELRGWPARRWAVAVLAAVGSTVLTAVPTALIATPWFGREIPPTWWAWPALGVSSVLAGLLTATYVRDGARTPAEDGLDRRATRGGTAGVVLTFFAVGCPVCNKLVLVALGTAGAIAWFEPVQPVLQVAATALLGWALVRRIDGERSCPVPVPVRVDA